MGPFPMEGHIYRSHGHFYVPGWFVSIIISFNLTLVQHCTTLVGGQVAVKTLETVFNRVKAKVAKDT